MSTSPGQFLEYLIQYNIGFLIIPQGSIGFTSPNGLYLTGTSALGLFSLDVGQLSVSGNASNALVLRLIRDLPASGTRLIGYHWPLSNINSSLIPNSSGQPLTALYCNANSFSSNNYSFISYVGGTTFGFGIDSGGIVYPWTYSYYSGSINLTVPDYVDPNDQLNVQPFTANFFFAGSGFLYPSTPNVNFIIATIKNFVTNPSQVGFGDLY